MASIIESSAISTKRNVVLIKRRRLEESTVGQYNIISTIGSGGCAKVMLANHMLTGEEVAIKVVDKTSLEDGEVKKLFREMRILKMLNHPNIVNLLEVIDTKKKLYLIMEYAAGGDLRDYVENHGRLNEKETRRIIRQIISALQYCHQKGIMHRDLKHENILISSNGNIKIADFGLSSLFSPGNKLSTYCGTLEYMAPEIVQGEEYGPEIDVWALGVILYSLLTDASPFCGTTSEVVENEILECSYEMPHCLSIDCKNLLKKIFVLDPKMRSNLKSIMRDKWINHGYEDELRPYVEPQQDSTAPVPWLVTL